MPADVAKGRFPLARVAVGAILCAFLLTAAWLGLTA